MDFGTNLRNLRIKRGMTQQELAKALEISQASITAYETNFRTPPVSVIQTIADYFRVPASELMPFNEKRDDNSVNAIAESIISNPKLKRLFEETRYLDDTKLDAVLSVVFAIKQNSKL